MKSGLSLIDRRAIKITQLSEDLEEAKGIIAEFVWPPDSTEEQRRKMTIRAARFAGCEIPIFSNDIETDNQPLHLTGISNRKA